MADEHHHHDNSTASMFMVVVVVLLLIAAAFLFLRGEFTRVPVQENPTIQIPLPGTQNQQYQGQ